MKRFILSVMFACVCVCVSAQGWETIRIEGDELKGTEETIAYTYTEQGMGSFVFWQNEESLFRLISDNGIFNIISSGGYVGMQIDVGIYDENDKLVEKFKMWLDEEKSSAAKRIVTRPGGSMSIPVGQKKKVKKIMQVIRGGNGYVRFLATRYDNSDFDLKVYSIK